MSKPNPSISTGQSRSVGGVKGVTLSKRYMISPSFQDFQRAMRDFYDRLLPGEITPVPRVQQDTLQNRTFHSPLSENVVIINSISLALTYFSFR
jgi:hypothetical protein